MMKKLSDRQFLMAVLRVMKPLQRTEKMKGRLYIADSRDVGRRINVALY